MRQANFKQKRKNVRIIFRLLLLLAVFAFTQATHAQVTIGAGEQPVSGALLQLKDKENVTDSSSNASKGLALPRVTLSDKHELYPMFLQNPGNPASGPNSDYTANKSTLDKSHTGLIVYNLVEDDDKELCLGLNQWDGKKWNCFQQKATTAQFEFDCSSVKVQGDYGDGLALNTSNYIKVSVTVTRIDSYSISATATPDNGYFFETSGIFYSTGTFSITISGTGQPVRHTQGTDLLDASDDTPDQFALTSSGGGTDCNFIINVRSTAARPEFTIDCGATVVEGMYFEDEPLTTVPNPINGQSHRIKVTLKNIPSTAYGAIAVLETNAVDGFSFKGEAVLSSSTQEIYLIGTGTPRGLDDKIFTITSNSESSTASCSVTVYMLIPRKRLLTIGNDDASYGYNPGWKTLRTGTSGYNSGNDLLTNNDNFGYNQWSILKFAGFTNQAGGTYANQVVTPNTWTDDNRDIVALNTAGWNGLSGARLERLLKGSDGQPKIDIVMIGYSTDWFRSSNTDDTNKAQALIDFVKSGGILMICSEHTVSNGNFMNKFFGVTNIGSADGAGAGSNYTLGFNPDNTPASMRPYYCKDDDPILRGPFEDILGRNWGEDASSTRYLTNLPLDEIVIYSGARPIGSTTQPAEGVTIFRHKDYPLVFIGDGGFNSNEVRTYGNTYAITVCPFLLTSKTINGKTYSNYPTFHNNFGGLGQRVYNAIFTANAFAWCIYKAEEYRRAHK